MTRPGSEGAPLRVTGAVVFALLIPWTLNDALDEPLDELPDVALQHALAAVQFGRAVLDRRP